MICLRQTPRCYNPGDYVQLIYADRLRSPSDKQRMRAVFAAMFGDKYPLHAFTGDYVITPSHVQVGNAVLARRDASFACDDAAVDKRLLLLHQTLTPLESLMQCVSMSWMSILVSRASVGLCLMLTE